MALKADRPPGEGYEFSKMIENSHLVLLDEPVMVYTTPTDQDCTIVLDDQDFPSDNSAPYNGRLIQLEGGSNAASHNFFEESKNGAKQQGLAIFEIFYDDCAPDQPECVDIKELTELRESSQHENDETIVISDDDDVIFVGAFKESKSKCRASKCEAADSEESGEGSSIRRNPIRSARNRSRDLSKELIYEEDFAFLDTSEEEEDEKENKLPEKKPAPASDLPKEWPVNVHERPEYNPETKRIESFDYTIRDIQRKTANKKPRLETVPVRRKPKKKYFTRRRRTACEVAEEKKVPVSCLKDLLESTTALLKEYFESSREVEGVSSYESETCNAETRLQVLLNQVSLLSLVLDDDQSDCLEKIFKSQQQQQCEEQ